MSTPVVSPSSIPSPSIADISPYGYLPTKSTCVIFVVLFGLSTLLHFLVAVRYRLWWLIPTACLAGGGEVVGWAGRLWSSENVTAHTPFTMQIVATIIAPTPFIAAIFIIFARLTERLGVCYSRLTPRWYSTIFLTSDIIALIVQGAGGGIAADATTVDGTNLGANVMLAGIVFQLAAQLVFASFAMEYFIRFLKDKPIREKTPHTRGGVTGPDGRPWNRRLQLMSIGVAVSTGFLIIRSIYRTVELGDGWRGVVLRTQVYFSVFDGAMVVLAMWTLNFFHPGWLLYAPSQLRASMYSDGVELEDSKRLSGASQV